MVALQIAFLSDASYRVVAIVGLFGAVLPMVFGMAYLLLPSYVGRTLSTPRLPGVHFLVAYAGTGLLAGHELFELGRPVLLGGTLLWSVGVGLFVAALLLTVVPAIGATSDGVVPSRTRSGGSTRLAMAAIPLAVGYLLVGTIALLSTLLGAGTPLAAPFPTVVHLYATGFVALLIFALGIRLVTGFFHVTPPTLLSWLVLLSGGVAPGVLSVNFWRPPWFAVGAGGELVAMMGYAALVAIVTYRTDRRRVGLYGIGFGALGGVGAVSVAFAAISGRIGALDIATHVTVALDGFLIPTIIGYAYQFFPVTNGRFRGATDRTALATIVLLGAGTVIGALGVAADSYWLRSGGFGLALIGAGGYAYLMSRKLLS
ncbi:MAG: hypothetical protein ABEI80_03470 [Haloplanus sp.]